ncbi:MAG: glutamate--tRNA ligase [Thermodesulfobacteriota bacterium]
MESVRVRFPPSPTGYLHIGGARTALFNWLFARKHGGTLVLRIEDTDLERSTPEAVEEILDGLRWMGIDWDEGPYFQSHYAHEHRQVARRLLESGHAYRCFCSKETLEAKREQAVRLHGSYHYDGACRDIPPEEAEKRERHSEPFVIRFRVPRDEGSVLWEDAVFGIERKAHKDIEDFVILRSNGTPIYLLSNMVDDHRDRITHVIRGQDHRANTPKQVLLYRALGWQVPVFAHISLTLDPKRRKISKRVHGDVVTVRYYREKGFLPWAFCNFIALLGWSPGDDREILSREELLQAFSLERLSRSNSVFNYDPENPKLIADPKAININAHYIRTMPLDELLPYVEEELKRKGIWTPSYAGQDKEWFRATVDLIRARFFTLEDFSTQGKAYFARDYPMDEKAWARNLKADPRLARWLPELAERLEALESFTVESTERVIREAAAQWFVKPGLIINAVRAAVTGQTVGPGLFDVLAALGQARVVERLRRVGQRLQKDAQGEGGEPS